MSLTLSNSESVTDYPSRTVESNSLRLFWNFCIFCLLYIHINNKNLHMTNSKLRNSDSAYSICFSQVLLKLFTFLINTADKEIYNIFNSFLFPYYFNTNRTNKQTHINRVLIIKIYTTCPKVATILNMYVV